MAEGEAMIIFKTHSAAAVFCKKYQQQMLDRKLLKVQLIPEITASKAAMQLLRNSTKNFNQA